MNVANEEQINLLVGNSIKKHRINANLKQSDLAAKIGISRTSIISIEQGRQNITLYMLWKIAISLNISIHRLLLDCFESQQTDIDISIQKRPHNGLDDGENKILEDFMSVIEAKQNIS